MSQLIAITFEDRYSADEARAAVRRMAGEGLLELQEAAIIEVDDDGKKRVRQDVDTVSNRQHVGHVAGLVAAAVTGTLPFILVGTVAGRLIGRLTDTGITNQLIKKLEQHLKPGTSVLILYGASDAERRPRIIERLRPWRPTLLESDMPPELEREIREGIEGSS